MTKSDAILKTFLPSSVSFGGDVLFEIDAARSLAKESQRQGLVILGMDFYRLENGEISPTTTSADYSDVAIGISASEVTTEAAINLLKKGMPDGTIYASFVFAGGK